MMIQLCMFDIMMVSNFTLSCYPVCPVHRSGDGRTQKDWIQIKTILHWGARMKKYQPHLMKSIIKWGPSISLLSM